jgi:hypothetical protein
MMVVGRDEAEPEQGADDEAAVDEGGVAHRVSDVE